MAGSVSRIGRGFHRLAVDRKKKLLEPPTPHPFHRPVMASGARARRSRLPERLKRPRHLAVVFPRNPRSHVRLWAKRNTCRRGPVFRPGKTRPIALWRRGLVPARYLERVIERSDLQPCFWVTAQIRIADGTT
jgi:hypothetical protein